MSKLDSWQSKYLSQAGRRCLINSVLQSIPIYTASASYLPAIIIGTINKICANFFWSGNEGPKRHWVSWSNITRPIEEGGLGIKSLHYIQVTMVAKQLWRILNDNSLWSQYVTSRYVKGHFSTIVKPFPTGVWKDVFSMAKHIVLSNTRGFPWMVTPLIF